KSKGDQRRGRLFLASERTFQWILGGYERSLAWVLRHERSTLAVTLLTIAVTVYLYVIVPKGFFPQQDTGRLTGNIQADQSILFQAMRQKLTDFVEIVHAA